MAAIPLQDEDPHEAEKNKQRHFWDMDDDMELNYTDGGHCPVHLGECLDSRYRVLHKLGNGGGGNVWLCRDMGRDGFNYVAVKVCTAEQSSESRELHFSQVLRERLEPTVMEKHFALPSAHFWMTSGNGSHICFVLPVLGPSIEWLSKEDSGDLGTLLRNRALQVTNAMAAMHASGVCHGDFRPLNVLLRSSNFDGLSEDELLSRLPKPYIMPPQKQVNVRRPMDQLYVPDYRVSPIDWNRVDSALATEQVCIIDFGECYEALSPPAKAHIPFYYKSPELILDNKPGVPSDIWALGCTLFEMRTNVRLFRPDMYTVWDQLQVIVDLLGPLPEPWWSTTWQDRKGLYEDEADSEGHSVRTGVTYYSAKAILDATDAEDDVSIEGLSLNPYSRSIAEALGKGHCDYPDGFNDECDETIHDEEIKSLEDLLLKMLACAPDRRISAQEAANHEWFRYSGPPGEQVSDDDSASDSDESDADES